MAEGIFDHLAGKELPEGSFTITEEENGQLLDVVCDATTPAVDAHPLWAYVATQRGIGISVADLCLIADFDVNDGPMLGSVEIDFLGPVETDVRYRVTGEVVNVVRKHGRSGTFDVLTYREHLSTDAGAQVASVTNTFILPRRNG